MLLLGVDPSKQLDHPLPTVHPHVTYAYMKYMWKSARTVGADRDRPVPMVRIERPLVGGCA